ncbi:carboxylate/amino acid/amine transporter [Dickeya zeae]|uniref:carboxylate/amino acid/amine transporter n=1 Tax=Dickeya zeae TaxID=204042 RepID=UPI00143FD08B|nr:carboxylate/amino acid/amine transporter [Dickeya zeae]QIZ45566.1 DMT family transporter [Dickeya zeae]
MPLLIITTIIWSFSFSLIGEYLAGQVDSWFSAMFRLLLAALVFLPFLRWRGYSAKALGLYLLVGVFQLGVMYLFLFRSYLYLNVPTILLFSVMTPLYVTLIYDLLSGHRLRWGYAFSALLAVLGAAVIHYHGVSDHFWWGLLLVQAANICFALGQVGYKRLMEVYPMPQHSAFSWFYLGAALVTLVAWALFGNVAKLPTAPVQWGVLAFLGVVVSGLGYFMWNYGATQVDAGTLSIMNNFHVPAGLLVNFAFWQKTPNWTSFAIGSAIIALALWVHRRWVVKRPAQTADVRRHAGAQNE